MAQHFEEMHIDGTDEQGWVVVRGKTTSLFEAYRTLLKLGNYAVVLEPPELVGMMREAIQEMAKLYQA